MDVTIVGCGPVGLVTGVGVALTGHDVTVVDTSQQRVAAVSRGEAVFYEPGLQPALAGVLREGRFRATSNLHSASNADLVMICVGTPSNEDGSIDTSILRKAVNQVAEALRSGDRYQTVVVRSTVTPGTTRSLVGPALGRVRSTRHEGLGLAVNPEFLREARAMQDFLNPDRIVIGETDAASGEPLDRLYRTFDAPVLKTSLESAEMMKYTTNTLLATLISFSNEIARICESIPGLDADEILAGVHLDRRLTHLLDGRQIPAGITHYLKAGCGYGGSCLPKDLRALISYARDRDVVPGLLEAVNSVNENQPGHLVDLAERSIGDLDGKRVLVLGLSFKEGTDDIRESPGIAVSEHLVWRGANVQIFDPIVKRSQVKGLLDLGAKFVDEPESVFHAADLCVVTTTDPTFKFIEVLANGSSGKTRPFIVDGRRAISRSSVHPESNYLAIGLSGLQGQS